MPLNPKLTKFTTVGPILATFDSVDVEEGAGIIDYNASSAKETTNTSYFLTRTDNPSDEVYTFAASNVTSFTEAFNVNFDITFQAPKDMAKGTAHIILALGIGTDEVNTKHIKAVVTLKKNTTTIGSAVESREVVRVGSEVAAFVPYSRTVNIPYPIALTVHFSIGDILRVNVAIIVKNVSGQADFALGHDPADREDERITADSEDRIFQDDQSTKSIISIPFKIKS